MVDICPTVDAEDEVEFRQQMKRVAPFTRRVHIDLGDGIFTPNRLVPISSVWWPGGVRADLHVMYKRPTEHIDSLIALGPQLIIVHAEAEGDFAAFANKIHRHGIEAGIALLQQTSPEIVEPALQFIDHVLIFSGNLGHQGGSQADLNLLQKASVLKAKKPSLEIGWDGGINDGNIKDICNTGIKVINVGAYIQHVDDPEAAYNRLQLIIGGEAS
jgi:ribulose-phosphate 3-epimerase